MSNRPVPTALRVLRGNPSKRPLPKGEPKPNPGTPDLPAWLDARAKAEWERIVPELLAIGVLTRVDRVALGAYCQAWSELEYATVLLEKEGRIIDEPVYSRGEQVGERKRAHPGVKLQRDAFARVKSFIVEFGLTPASRTRISVIGVAKEADPMEAFLKRGKPA